VICEGVSIELPWGEIVQPSSGDSYTYTWSSAVTGCDSLLVTVDVHVLDLQAIDLPDQVTIELGDSVQLQPVFGFIVDSLRWTPIDWLSCDECPEPWSTPSKTIDYLLSAWSKEGCLVTATIQIIVNRDITLYVPNVFSPNGDGTNDLFTVYSKRNVGLVNQFAIFDRWGELLWEHRDFVADGTVGWDGTFHGELMQSGVYAWICEVEDLDGSVKRLKGDLVLVR
jgi:gliding motility-associated-like protein